MLQSGAGRVRSRRDEILLGFGAILGDILEALGNDRPSPVVALYVRRVAPGQLPALDQRPQARPLDPFRRLDARIVEDGRHEVDTGDKVLVVDHVLWHLELVAQAGDNEWDADALLIEGEFLKGLVSAVGFAVIHREDDQRVVAEAAVLQGVQD